MKGYFLQWDSTSTPQLGYKITPVRINLCGKTKVNHFQAFWNSGDFKGKLKKKNKEKNSSYNRQKKQQLK